MAFDVRKLNYKWWNGEDIPADVLAACARLFSDHYGKWSEQGVAPGRPIRLTPDGLRGYLPPHASLVVTAWAGEGAASELVGYALALRVKDKKHRIITWVTQLVVHARHQNRGVAKTMLNSIWGFSDHYAWGIASANPYAIRALEKATKRRCRPGMIAQSIGPVLEAAGKHIGYLRDRRRDCSAERSIIDTGFHQDHSLIPERLAAVAASTDGKKNWRLGQIGPGEEWLGVTFNRQKPIRWTDKEFNDFMAAADQIVREAYDRMALSRRDKEHKWARHADAEAAFIVGESGLLPGAAVLDFGCGDGRHARALTRLGYAATGVDFSPEALSNADQPDGDAPAPTFVQGDCRTIVLDRQFDMGLCLYDVVGSFPDDDDNMRILNNLAHHIRTGGMVAVSVMSYPYTAARAIYTANIIGDSRPLERLKAGRIMQETGNIFDPEHFVLNTRSRVVYRKEQFDIGAPLPKEIIVRDRRYDIDEITTMCRKVGIDVIRAGHVAPGRFAEMEGPGGKLLPEILVIGRKNSII
jgi:2-polyprenyl-3-methyl-5-hydroxy-6-metoxy-1,4-benzoquinol methylase/GNAT superfamily N-acetyltransferase